MGNIITRPRPSGGGSGVYTQSEKLAIELEMELKAAQASYYKEFAYEELPGNQTGDLLSITFYTSSSKTTTMFTKAFTYTAGALTQTLLTRISDSAILTKNLVYDIDDNLISIDVAAS